MISDTHNNASWKGNQQEQGNLNKFTKFSKLLGCAEQIKLKLFSRS